MASSAWYEGSMEFNICNAEPCRISEGGRCLFAFLLRLQLICKWFSLWMISYTSLASRRPTWRGGGKLVISHSTRKSGIALGSFVTFSVYVYLILTNKTYSKQYLSMQIRLSMPSQRQRDHHCTMHCWRSSRSTLHGIRPQRNHVTPHFNLRLQQL